MKLLFIISVGVLLLLLTSSAEAARLGGIEPSIELLNALETRQESLKGCSMSSLDKCYGTVPPDGSVPNDLLEEIGHISDAQTCQRFCNELYDGTCQWFMFDKTTEDCKLFSSSLNDLWNDCREVGYAREPNHELCDEMFPSNSINGCYNFREDYCRYEFSLLENLEEIDSPSECQLACQYINNCSYFVYDSPSKICKLNTLLSQKTCDIIHGTPEPDLNACISGGKIDWASNSGQPLTTEMPETASSQTSINGTTLLATTRTSQAPTTTTTTTTTTTPTTTTSAESGDAKLGADGIPYLFWEGTWSPICGHYFWDSQYGAEAFCKKLGFNGGSFNREVGAYDEDAIQIGKCNSGEAIDSCAFGGNEYKRTNWCKAGKGPKISISCEGQSPETEADSSAGQ